MPKTTRTTTLAQVIPEGYYFVLGDHRNTSSERRIGIVPTVHHRKLAVRCAAPPLDFRAAPATTESPRLVRYSLTVSVALAKVSSSS